MQQPQRIWLRRALFQIHLWTGIGVGLYVLVVSITGSVVIFRNELNTKFTIPPIFVPKQEGPMLTDEELTAIAEKTYPGFKVSNIFHPRPPRQRRGQPAPPPPPPGERAIEVWMERGEEKLQRNLQPYTGADLGDSVGNGLRAMNWMLDLHDNLLAGDSGRAANGVGGGLLTVLCITGGIIWWPGIKNWKRSLLLHRKAGWKRFNWDLHSMVGFWFFAFVFIWGISGVYLSFANPFNALMDFLEPLKDDATEPRLGDNVLVWLGRLHFGRFYGMPMKITWAILGLVPPILFVTGAVMWWNRVLRPALNPAKPTLDFVER